MNISFISLYFVWGRRLACVRLLPFIVCHNMNTSCFPRLSGFSSKEFISLCLLLTGFPTQRSVEQFLLQKGFLNGRHHHHHHHKHQGLGPLIRPVSTVTAAHANASSVFQLFSFLLVCSCMISKGFGFVAFFASVKVSSICIHLSCLVCL